MKFLKKLNKLTQLLPSGWFIDLDTNSGAADNDKGKKFKIPPHVRFKDSHISYKR